MSEMPASSRGKRYPESQVTSALIPNPVSVVLGMCGDVIGLQWMAAEKKRDEVGEVDMPLMIDK